MDTDTFILVPQFLLVRYRRICCLQSFLDFQILVTNGLGDVKIRTELIAIITHRRTIKIVSMSLSPQHLKTAIRLMGEGENLYFKPQYFQARL